jgi:hypothetical protein
MGSGSFGWPVRQAVANWIYGAIRWECRQATTTEKSVWAILCVPAPGDQAAMKGYLSCLSGARGEKLVQRQWGLRIRLQDVESEELPVSDDLLLGAVARNAFSSLRTNEGMYCPVKRLSNKSTGQIFEYWASEPLAKATFANSDTIVRI